MTQIIITGISKGIGKAIFNKIPETFEVIGISRSLEVANESSKKNIIKCDLSNLIEVERLDFGFCQPDIDLIFINNAAIIEPIAMNGNISTHSIEEIYKINVIAPMILVQKLLKLTKPEKIKIINITSGVAKNPLQGWSMYSSTKAAIEIFFKTLVLEFPNIKLINFDPGVVDTEMQAKIRSKNIKEFPLVENFRDLKNKNILQNAKSVAVDIIKMIEK